MDKIVIFAGEKLLFQKFLCYKEDIIEPKCICCDICKIKYECENCN